MEKIDEYGSFLGEVIRQIEGDELSTLDFDSLKETLVDVSKVLKRAEQVSKELEVLRQDYTGRISGMEKAIAVASRRDSGIEKALELIGALDGLSATELTVCYSRTQARFRDAFPASFGLFSNSTRQAKKTDLTEYK